MFAQEPYSEVKFVNWFKFATAMMKHQVTHSV